MGEHDVTYVKLFHFIGGGDDDFIIRLIIFLLRLGSRLHLFLVTHDQLDWTHEQ